MKKNQKQKMRGGEGRATLPGRYRAAGRRIGYGHEDGLLWQADQEIQGQARKR